MSTLVSTDPKQRRRRKRGGERWVSEVKGILALLAAGFGLVALATFDPSVTPGDQQGPTGPVGAVIRDLIADSSRCSRSRTEAIARRISVRSP